MSRDPAPGGSARDSWLAERRRIIVERYDTLHAPTYDEEWGAISPSHARMIWRFLAGCPPAGQILDAACGTGKYWPMILASGRTVRGIDQSAGMLRRAAAKFPEVPTELGALLDLSSVAAHDGAMCVDAMEMIFPEDWPRVLARFHQALRPAGPLYLTVELADPDAVEAAYRRAQGDGLPVVPGEWLEQGGYHYYPPRNQVLEWLADAGFAIVQEAIGDEYLHLIVRRA